MKFRATLNLLLIEIHKVTFPIFPDTQVLHLLRITIWIASQDRVLFWKALVIQIRKVQFITFMKVNVHKVELSCYMHYSLYSKGRYFWEEVPGLLFMEQHNPMIQKDKIRHKFFKTKINNNKWIRKQLNAKWLKMTSQHQVKTFYLQE